MEIKKLFLHNFHKDFLKAEKFLNFYGYLMPLNYSSGFT